MEKDGAVEEGVSLKRRQDAFIRSQARGGKTNEIDNLKESTNHCFKLPFMQRYLQWYQTRNHFQQQAVKLGFCFVGLQSSYLTWGYTQEFIMTTNYTPTAGVPNGIFPSPSFFVFCNRIIALLVAGVAVYVRNKIAVAPMTAYTPPAISNVVSSWCQSASLYYVSFPLLTVFKTSKIIPVMVMGKLLKGTNYSFKLYMEALLITIGVTTFSLAMTTNSSRKLRRLLSEEDYHVTMVDQDEELETTTTQRVGFLLLILYVLFDAFTKQYQDRIYTQYGRRNVDAYQMMLGINISALVVNITGQLLRFEGLQNVLEFVSINPTCIYYLLLSGIVSTTGQLFLFYTTQQFGPVVLTTIMTTRQMFSFCLSAVLFEHQIPDYATSGAVLVFGVLFYQITSKYVLDLQRTELERELEERKSYRATLNERNNLFMTDEEEQDLKHLLQNLERENIDDDVEDNTDVDVENRTKAEK